MFVFLAVSGCVDIHYAVTADILLEASPAAPPGPWMLTLWVEQPGVTLSAKKVLDLDQLPSEDQWFEGAIEGRQNGCGGPATYAWAGLSALDPATGEWVEAVTSDEVLAFEGTGLCGFYASEVALTVGALP